ncbi:hypothetical protein EYM_04000 [Ignicoccus islandicus DSM 13165]|uniref:PDZ domain-containing protein n=1 Tax=Ignicoccus islandicus DSM 13165 TaxID=940295 RepID=A0A0U3DY76_9CREN|nr:M50 family metallopeptidase [Ignicoccus islandicus]ALU12458.1 hypothetical protein EYM_04000 [Ignicoccus islandicus DSM 13165]
MEASGFAMLSVLIASILAYFIPAIRNGKRVFSPMPGIIALRLEIRGNANATDNIYTKVVLNASLVFFLIAMFMGYYLLISNLLPKTQKSVTLVPLLPGITISFSRLLSILWIIGLSIVIHEYMHYWSSIKQGVSVKSAGIGWAFVFPIAFVEPDENELLRAPLLKRIRIYAAGPAANMFLALLTYLIIWNLLKPGIFVIDVVEGSPAWNCGIMKGDVILSINDIEVKSLYKLKELISNNEVLKIKILRGNKVIEIIAKPEKGKLGIIVLPFVPAWPLSSLPLEMLQAVVSSLVWLNGINLGLAVINALPLFISDGGRVLTDVGQEFKKFEKVTLVVQALTVFLVAQALIGSIRSLG